MNKTILAGSYTTPESPEIARLLVDTETGAITPLASLKGISNPIYFAINKAKTRLYAAQAVEPDSRMKGAVAVYSLDSGLMPSLIGCKEFSFTVPCHISLNHKETKLLFAEYSFAHAGTIELNDDGTFSDKISIIEHHGHGPNEKRQEAAHCHQALPSPDDTTLFVCDLGIDTIKAYDLTQSELAAKPDCDFLTHAGYGPRHMIFNYSGTVAYAVYELESKVQVLAYANGQLSPLQEPLSMLPEGFAGETKAAAIRISPSGKWLLASNRGHDSIAAFPIKSDGTLGVPVISKLIASFPRYFDFVDKGDIIVVGHKMSDIIGTYRFNDADGSLTETGYTYAIHRPLAFIG